MAQDELKDFRAGGLAIPALFVALLALLGVVNLPGRGVSPPALPGASSTEAASGASSVGETVPRPSEGCRDKDSTLAILKPLERFYALRLERLQFQKKDSAGRVRWMLDGTKTCDDLEVLIAIVPDPIQSGSAHRFDITVNAILLAMRRAGYLLDSFQLQDWKSRPGSWTPPLGVRGALLSPRGVDLSIGEGAPRDPDERLPGLILLRKYPNPAKREKEWESHALIALVLVAETPIRGVHPKMLQQGLDLAANVWTERHKAENALADGPIARIIGPNFSGTQSSIVRTVRSWLEARKQDLQLKVKPYRCVISWINGQASSLNPKLFDESFKDIWESAVQFQSVAYGSRDLNFRLFSYLANHCTPRKGGDRVAYLTEETTGFGYRFGERIRLMESKGFDLKLKRSLNDVSGIPKEDKKNLIIVADVNHVLHFLIFDGNGKVVVDTDEKRLTEQEQARQIEKLRKDLESLWPPHELPENDKDKVITAVTSIVGRAFKVFVYSFPAHISEIRRCYARQAAATPQQGVTLKSAEQLGFAYDEGADTPEMISIESPGVMAANDEMRLLRIAQDIHRRGIRFACIMATDMRDLLFVADYLQTHCPNTQLVSLSTEEAFTHHEQISKLRGMLFATTYPLWMKNQDAGWTVPDQKTAQSELRLLVVPNDASLVTYNATLAHLIELAPVDQPDQREDLLRGLIGYGWPGDSLPTTPPIWITVAGQQGYYPIDVVGPLTLPLKRPQGPGGYGYYKNALWQPPVKLSDVDHTRFPCTRELTWHRSWVLTSGVSPLLPPLLALVALVICTAQYFRKRRASALLGSMFFPLPLGSGRGPLGRAADCVTALYALARPFPAALLGEAPRWAVLAFVLVGTLAVGLVAWLVAHWSAQPALVLEWLPVPLLVILLVIWLLRAAWLQYTPLLSVVALAVAPWVAAFLLIDLATIEPYSDLQVVLQATLLLLFGLVLYTLVGLPVLWMAFREITDSVLGLPLGQTFDRLPRRLTSRFASFGEAMSGSLDAELKGRFAQLRGALRAGLPAADQWPSDVPDPHRLHRLTAACVVLAYSGQCPPCGPWAARTLAYLLQPIWHARGTREAYADQPGGSEASGPAGSGSASALSDTATAKTIAAFVGQADEYIALEIVQYLNRYLDIVWNRITTLTLLSLLLMTAVNSYPFQPAGALFNWMIVVILLAVAVVVSVLWGIQRNEFIARVNKAGVNRSLWNLEFVGKLTAYVAPVLGLLAVLSVGVSDVLRIVLGPFAR